MFPAIWRGVVWVYRWIHRWNNRTVHWIASWSDDQKRGARWVLIGTLAVTILMLRDISGLLGSIESTGERSYDAGVFTGPKLLFWDIEEFREALRVWRDADTAAFDVVGLIQWHVGLDIFPFIPAYAALFGLVIRRVGASARFAAAMAIALFFVDEIETVMTAFALVGTELEINNGFVLGAIRFFSLMKWLVLATGLFAIASLWPRPIEGSSNAGSGLAQVRAAKQGLDQAPAISVSGLTFLVVALGAIVALPAGGPLEQLPDVVRNHLSAGDFDVWALSITGLSLFAVAVAVAGLVATAPSGRVAPERTIRDSHMIVGAIIASLVLLVLGCLIDGNANPAALAPTIVVVALTIGAALADVARRRIPVRPEPRKDAQEPVPSPLAGRLHAWDSRAAVWVGGLVGAVVIIGGLGLVRAAFSPFVLGLTNERFPWGIATSAGFLSIFLAAFVQWGLSRLLIKELRRWQGVLGLILVVAAVLAAAIWLMLSPSSGRLWGSTGVVGVGFAFWALVVGVFTWVSRTRPHWEVPNRLSFGKRTPWLTLLVVTWVLASFLNTRGGFHDARVADRFGPTEPTYENLEEAFREWRKSQTNRCGSELDRVPLILVAAPGGGIRAAYWTVAALDTLFDDVCKERVFAISGVSGGSVGAATWVAAASQGQEGTAAVTRMSDDDALPGTLAAFLLRDLPQPLLGITEGWADRTAVLEDGWIESANVFGSLDDPRTWADLAAGAPNTTLPFIPVLTLNGSSVNDGCRVLVSNVGDLPAAAGQDCQAAPEGDQQATGPISGSIDAFTGLYERDDANKECGGRESGMRSTTAALLSARFPIVTPSAALLRCLETVGGGHVDTTSYSVDGGYYENSGLLTLLQIWAEIEDAVREHNQGAGESDNPLATKAIEPWIVVIDNHYRSNIRRGAAGRPLETLAVLTAAQKEVLTQTMLEQVASFEMSEIDSACSVTGSPEALNPAAAEEPLVECARERRDIVGFVRIAPSISPDVTAPLGWVLSPATRTNLNKELVEQLTEESRNDDRSLDLLLEYLQYDEP